MGRIRTTRGYLYDTPTPHELAEMLSLALVKTMRLRHFDSLIKKNEYLMLMSDGSMLFLNDVSFYQNCLAVIPSKELYAAINEGKIGELVTKKCGVKNEYRKKNARTRPSIAI